MILLCFRTTEIFYLTAVIKQKGTHRQIPRFVFLSSINDKHKSFSFRQINRIQQLNIYFYKSEIPQTRHSLCFPFIILMTFQTRPRNRANHFLIPNCRIKIIQFNVNTYILFIVNLYLSRIEINNRVCKRERERKK